MESIDLDALPDTPAAALDVLLSVDPQFLTAEDACRLQGRIEHERHRLEARVAVRLGEFGASNAYRLDGSRSPAAWLASHTGTGEKTAGGRAWLAERLEVLPDTQAAWLAGAISEDHARAVAVAWSNPRVRDLLTQREHRLVDQARRMTADRFTQHLRNWVETHDFDGPAPDDPDRNIFRFSKVGDRWHGRLDLDDQWGTELNEALDDTIEQLRRDREHLDEHDPTVPHRRTRATDRAEALRDLVADGDAARDSDVMRRRPLLNIHLDAGTYLGHDLTEDSLRQLDDGTIIPLPVLGRWRCTADIRHVFADAHGAVKALLDEGDDERYATEDQRQALIARDRGCAVPGCGRPPRTCHAHHVRWWPIGPTDLDNLVLVCEHHHRAIHNHQLHVEMHHGIPVFTDRHGRELTENRRRHTHGNAA